MDKTDRQMSASKKEFSVKNDDRETVTDKKGQKISLKTTSRKTKQQRPNDYWLNASIPISNKFDSLTEAIQ